MDAELLTQIEGYVAQHSQLRWLSRQESLAKLDALASKFGIPATQIWWWEGRADAQHICYGDTDGLAEIEKFLDSTTQVLLFVTDDEPPSWPCVAGQLGELMAMVREQRFFEFFITDQELRWVVFDTHHNELVIIGDLRFNENSGFAC